MDGWLAFAQGPLFRLTFLIMILGLARIVILTIWDIGRAIRRGPKIPLDYWGLALKTLGWLIPVTKLHRQRPVLSVTSFLFHAGLIVVPIFLVEHIELWRAALGIGWPGIPRLLADVLSFFVIVTGLILFGVRCLNRRVRSLSGPIDYILVFLLIEIFLTGFIASRSFNPFSYNLTMLMHVLGGECIFVLIPFTKLSHCILFPLIRLATEIAWRFAPRAGEEVVRTVHGEVKPI